MSCSSLVRTLDHSMIVHRIVYRVVTMVLCIATFCCATSCKADPRRDPDSFTTDVSITSVASTLFGNPVFALADDGTLVRKSTHPIWFDADQSENGEPVPDVSELRRPDVSDRLDRTAEDRRSRSWYEFLFGWLSPSSTGGKSVIADFLTIVFQSWRVILVVALALLLMILVFLLIKLGKFWEPNGRRKNKERSLTLEQEAAKIVDLPFEMEQPLLGLLAQAEKYRNEGNYSAATIYLFSYALIELDAAHFIRLERGKTNRTYLRELRGHDLLSGFARDLVVAFEFAFFGKHTIQRETLEAIWAQLPSFQSYIAQPSSMSSQNTAASMQPLTPIKDFA